MGHAARIITSPYSPTAEVVSKEATSATVVSRELIVVASLLIAFQVLDGVLTAIGVSQLGLHAEGNPLLRMLMSQIGLIPALVAVKTVAVAVICTLFFLATQVSWVVQAMKVVAAIYLFGAIIPWSGILLLRVS